MNIIGNKKFYARSLSSLVLIAVFLMLGFCPLRNALCKLVQQEPATTTAKVPEYGKIIAHDDCSTPVVMQALMPTDRPLDGPPLLFILPAMVWLGQPLVRSSEFSSYVHATTAFHSLPIYLCNRSLRI